VIGASPVDKTEHAAQDLLDCWRVSQPVNELTLCVGSASM
jgi:hypothetical protein